MERKEPVVAPNVVTLDERIPLTWREVNELATVKPAPQPTTASTPEETPGVNAAPEVATTTEPNARPLSDEEITILCEHLTPVLEKAVRDTLSQTLEMTLHNALMRVRSDLDRSIQPMVRQAIERELRAENLANLLIRKHDGE